MRHWRHWGLRSGSEGHRNAEIELNIHGLHVLAHSVSVRRAACVPRRLARMVGSPCIDLPVGVYTLTVSSPGFESKKIGNLEIIVSRTTNITVQLGVAQQNPVIEVSASADNNDAFQNAAAVNQGGVADIAGTLLPTEAIDPFSVQSNAGP